MRIDSCSMKQTGDHQQKINKELAIIDSLLRSEAYAMDMAETLQTAYYTGIGQVPPPFFSQGEVTATFEKSIQEEKIATNMAAFYALECSLGILCDQTKQVPVACLKSIADRTADPNAVLLINRFANATWKASQPFRGLSRIKRGTFRGYNFLTEAAVKKGYDQVAAAASKLLDAMQDVKDSSTEIQFSKIRSLMQDDAYTEAMAIHLDSFYYINQHKPVIPFFIVKEETTTIRKTVKEQKIAINIAGFYALECGLNYFVTTKNMLPSTLLDSIINNTINDDDKIMFARFANATWKAGQPFRGLQRIHKDNFIPASMLSEAELEKDFIQIKAAAKKLRMSL